MGQTLFVTGNHSEESIFKLNLKMYVDVEVVSKTNASGAIDLIKVLPSIDLIITKSTIGTEKTALDLYEYLKSNDCFIPMIVLGENSGVPDDDAIFLTDTPELKDILQAVAKKLGVTAKDMAKKLYPDFSPFGVHLFAILKSTPCDVYLDSNGEERVFEANGPISENNLHNLISGGTKELFIPSSQRLKFTNFYTDIVAKKITNDKTPEQEKMLVTDKAMSATREHIQKLGLDENAVKLAKSCMTSIFKTATTSKNKGPLEKLMSKLLENCDSFNYIQSQLTAFVACHIIENMDWGSEEQQEKIVFISFFHNILLTDDNMCRISNEEELGQADFSDKEEELIKKHAQLTAEIIQKYPKAPMGADIILKQHHGSKTGVGFPEPIQNNLSPLAIVFVIAEKFTNYVLKESNDISKVDKEEIVSKLREIAPKGNKAKQAIDCLDTLPLSIG